MFFLPSLPSVATFDSLRWPPHRPPHTTTTQGGNTLPTYKVEVRKDLKLGPRLCRLKKVAQKSRSPKMPWKIQNLSSPTFSGRKRAAKTYSIKTTQIVKWRNSFFGLWSMHEKNLSELLTCVCVFSIFHFSFGKTKEVRSPLYSAGLKRLRLSWVGKGVNFAFIIIMYRSAQYELDGRMCVFVWSSCALCGNGRIQDRKKITSWNARLRCSCTSCLYCTVLYVRVLL